MELHPAVAKINDIYKNLDMAQQLKGKLSMAECRVLQKSCTRLAEKFLDEKREVNEDVTKADKDALEIIKQVCDIFQGLGTFSMKGSADLLDSIEYIEKYL